MKTPRHYLCAIALVGAGLTLVGCSKFDRATYTTLSTSKAVLDEAQADYEARAITTTVDGQTRSIPISRTACAKFLIERGKEAQTIAVTAAEEYAKLEKAKAAGVDAQKAVLVADLAQLSPLVAEVQTLVSSNFATCHVPGVDREYVYYDTHQGAQGGSDEGHAPTQSAPSTAPNTPPQN